MSEDELDNFMSDRLNLRYGGYNSAVDIQIYNIAKAIMKAREDNTYTFNTELAERFGLSPEHVELIQYILCAVRYDEMNDNAWGYRSAFTYGTSPRGMFVDDDDQAKRFLAEFRDYYIMEWGEDPDAALKDE